MNQAKIFIAFTFLLAFAVCVSAQGDLFPGIPMVNPSLEKKKKDLELGVPSPNEIENYKFFKEGKLNKLKLGISNKEDVKTLLEVKLDEFYNTELYEYDSNWLIRFEYFDEKYSGFTRSSVINGVQINSKFIVLTENVGRIFSVKLFSRKAIPFCQVSFSDEFGKHTRTTFKRNNSEKVKISETDFYEDSYGLEYKISKKISSNSLENKNSTCLDYLISVEYTIPYNWKEKMFVEQK